MNDWIRFCKCNRYILTTGQMQEGKPCELCQKEMKEHAMKLRDRVLEAQKEERNGEN